MGRFLQWFFRNRNNGAITIAQSPNLVLWIVIVGSVVIWACHPAGRLGATLEIVVKAAIFVGRSTRSGAASTRGGAASGCPCWVMS
jgi:hypothetical protein